jgi:hypothetical protein
MIVDAPYDAPGRPRGWFRLDVFENGRLIERVSEPNLVVTGAAAIQAALLGGSVANMSVTQIGFGTGSAIPVVGNSSLTGPFLKAIDSVTYPVAGSVTFNFTLATGEDNGMSISEYGLLTAGGLLFARKVRAAPLPKTSAISLSSSWTIVF